MLPLQKQSECCMCFADSFDCCKLATLPDMLKSTYWRLKLLKLKEFCKDDSAPVACARLLLTAAAALLASAIDAVVMANTTMANAVCSRTHKLQGVQACNKKCQELS